MELYYPVEQALLADYFGVPRPKPLRDLNIWVPDPKAARKAIHLEEGASSDEWALPNAVARIALSRIQDRLPQWYTSRGGEVIAARKEYAATGGDVLLMPLHLFTINWADSAPGMSWPEAYHLTWFPEFDRYVVTASADSTDAWGYEDRAIGHFGQGGDRMRQAREIITAFWRMQFHQWEQAHWAYLLDTGAVDSEEALAWAKGVWEPEEED